MAIDYEKLREHIRQQYLNPPPDCDPEVAEVQPRFAGIYADLAVQMTREVSNQTSPLALGIVLMMASVQALVNMLDHLSDPELKAGLTELLTTQFAHCIKRPDDLIASMVDVPEAKN